MLAELEETTAGPKAGWDGVGPDSVPGSRAAGCRVSGAAWHATRARAEKPSIAVPIRCAIFRTPGPSLTLGAGRPYHSFSQSVSRQSKGVGQLLAGTGNGHERTRPARPGWHNHSKKPASSSPRYFFAPTASMSTPNPGASSTSIIESVTTCFGSPMTMSSHQGSEALGYSKAM